MVRVGMPFVIRVFTASRKSSILSCLLFALIRFASSSQVYRSARMFLAFDLEDIKGSLICCWFYVEDLLRQVVSLVIDWSIVSGKYVSYGFATHRPRQIA